MLYSNDFWLVLKVQNQQSDNCGWHRRRYCQQSVSRCLLLLLLPSVIMYRSLTYVCVMSSPLVRVAFWGSESKSSGGWGNIWHSSLCWNPEFVCLRVRPCRHMSTSSIQSQTPLISYISHPTPSCEALFKYLNPDCPSLQPICFTLMGSVCTARPCGRHTEWRVKCEASFRISTALASSPLRHLLPPNPPLP